MRLLLLFLFLAYPLLEIAVMIKLGGWIGFWPMLAIIVATVGLGVIVLHRHGFTMLQRMAEEMAAGRPPVAAMVEGALHAMAGLMLIAPGLITDSIGLALLIAPLRQWIARKITHKAMFDTATFEMPQRMEVNDPAGGENGGPDRFRRKDGPRAQRAPIVIDGEYERLDERTIDPKDKPKPPGTPAND